MTANTITSKLHLLAGEAKNVGGPTGSLVRFLVSEGWWFTGHCLLADGGYAAR